MTSLANVFQHPFDEQVEFFRQKINLPTQRWNDIQQADHDHAFIVAGAMKAELLTDLRQAVQKAIATGSTLETFRKDFATITARHGWTNYTGSDTANGRAWRTRIIYETNLRTSFAAGRWKQLKANADIFAYWEWVHMDGRHPRPEHVAWNGTILPHDDAWWAAHYPPCGWGCKCRVRGVSRGEMEDRGKDGPDEAPPVVIDPKTGLDKGIDKGWDYAPGASWYPGTDKYPYPVARDAVQHFTQAGITQRWMTHIRASLANNQQLAETERLPLAILPPAIRAALGVTSQTLYLSARQLATPAGQALTPEMLLHLQSQLEAASPETIKSSGKGWLLKLQQAGQRWQVLIRKTAALLWLQQIMPLKD